VIAISITIAFIKLPYWQNHLLKARKMVTRSQVYSNTMCNRVWIDRACHTIVNLWPIRAWLTWSKLQICETSNLNKIVKRAYHSMHWLARSLPEPSKFHRAITHAWNVKIAQFYEAKPEAYFVYVNIYIYLSLSSGEMKSFTRNTPHTEIIMIRTSRDDSHSGNATRHHFLPCNTSWRCSYLFCAAWCC